jgi:hypothetical protein
VPTATEPTTADATEAPPTPTIIEVDRHGRRPRYHRGATLANGVLLLPEQCNLDQVSAGYRPVAALPPRLRPAQVCRRCFGVRVEL